MTPMTKSACASLRGAKLALRVIFGFGSLVVPFAGELGGLMVQKTSLAAMLTQYYNKAGVDAWRAKFASLFVGFAQDEMNDHFKNRYLTAASCSDTV